MTNVVTHFISRGVAVGAFLLFAAGVAEVRAQQTLFNVPSANTAERGKTFIELTSSSALGDQRPAPITARSLHL